MAKIEHQRVGKMVILRVQHKIGLASQYREPAQGGQALIFGPAKVGNQGNGRGLGRGGAQKANAPRFDQGADGRGTAGHQAPGLDHKLGAVVRHKCGPKRDKPQGKGRFART